MTQVTFLIIIGGVLLNALAQLLLKVGTSSLGALFPVGERHLSELMRIVLQPYIFSGLICYVVSVSMWIAALSKVPVSVAYPMLSIGYVVNAIAAYYLLNEELGLQKLVGIGIIIIGVFIVARS
jgi:drug/metabolite transporter (DMT)-like permease